MSKIGFVEYAEEHNLNYSRDAVLRKATWIDEEGQVYEEWDELSDDHLVNLVDMLNRMLNIVPDSEWSEEWKETHDESLLREKLDQAYESVRERGLASKTRYDPRTIPEKIEDGEAVLDFGSEEE